MTMDTEARTPAGMGLSTRSLQRVLIGMALIGVISWFLLGVASRPGPADLGAGFPDRRVALARMQAVFPEIDGADDVWGRRVEAGGRGYHAIFYAGGDQAKAVRAYVDAAGRMTALEMRVDRDQPTNLADQAYYIAPIVAAVSGAAPGRERAAAVDALAAMAQRGQPGAIDIGPSHISITTLGGFVVRATPRGAL